MEQFCALLPDAYLDCTDDSLSSDRIHLANIFWDLLLTQVVARLTYETRVQVVVFELIKRVEVVRQLFDVGKSSHLFRLLTVLISHYSALRAV